MNALRRLPLNPWFCLASLALLFGLFEFHALEFHVGGLPLDLWVQDRFFNFSTHTWRVEKRAQPWDWIFYKGALIALYTLAGALAATLFVKPHQWRARGLENAWFADWRKVAFVLACMAVIPIAVALSKITTDVYVPADLARYYGGKSAPYVHVLEPYPAEFLARRVAEHIKPGKSFPAGHASGGFALMAFFFVWPGRRKWAGLAVGLVVGWTMGIYKMLIGDHYLSHTLITCVFAWLVCASLDRLWKYFERRRALPAMAA